MNFYFIRLFIIEKFDVHLQTVKTIQKYDRKLKRNSFSQKISS
jgi:hypothetical protein